MGVFQSVSAWNEFCPDEPYDFLLSCAKPYEQKSKYDILDAVQRQRNFNYQVMPLFYTQMSFWPFLPFADILAPLHGTPVPFGCH
jgi:hypothetical protein